MQTQTMADEFDFRAAKLNNQVFNTEWNSQVRMVFHSENLSPSLAAEKQGLGLKSSSGNHKRCAVTSKQNRSSPPPNPNSCEPTSVKK